MRFLLKLSKAIHFVDSCSSQTHEAPLRLIFPVIRILKAVPAKFAPNLPLIPPLYLCTQSPWLCAGLAQRCLMGCPVSTLFYPHIRSLCKSYNQSHYIFPVLGKNQFCFFLQAPPLAVISWGHLLYLSLFLPL